MPKPRAIGQFAPGTWVRRANWPLDHQCRVVQTRAELVAVVEELDAEVASTARVSVGEVFPLLVEVYGHGVTWTDELCVADAVAMDWEPAGPDQPAHSKARPTKPYV